jgi:osmotically-inducible protein OsmY
MIDSRYSNKNLQVIVLQTILKSNPHFKQRLTVTADAKGIIHLRGSAQNRREMKTVVELARGVAGVTDVFCNLAVKA